MQKKLSILDYEDNDLLPHIDSRLRKNILRIPDAVFQASGIVVNGRHIKSFVFTTDLAVIRNCAADAVFAVYPFTPPAGNQRCDYQGGLYHLPPQI